MNELFFILVGYLSGSILYAYLLPKYICHIDIMKDSDDHNPGTFLSLIHISEPTRPY